MMPVAGPVRAPRYAFVVASATIALIILLVLAFGGVQWQWYLPVYAALFVMAGFALFFPGRFDWLDGAVLLVLMLPLAQLFLHRTTDSAVTASTWLAGAAAAAAFVAMRRSIASTPDRASAWLGRTGASLAAAGGLLAFEAILQLFLTPTRILGLIEVTTATPMGTFVDRDHFAACMGLLLPFALVLALDRRRNSSAVFWALCAVLMLAATVLSLSRGGVIAAGGEIIAFAVWEGIRHRNVTMAIVSVMALLVAAVLYAGSYRYMLARLSPNGLHDTMRMNTVRSSIAMGEARPTWGWGLGTWDAVYPRYALFDDGSDPEYAHCEYAQLFAEAGMAGITLLSLLGLALAYAAYGGIHAYPQISIASILALSGYALHASMDFIFHIPALLLLTALLAAMTTAHPLHTSRL
ncbi:MAG TPA: O-antigen ligase family protein [Terriglobales bacterium]|nr:O-antigen ligase family protein [Terriglobales bacterium]